MVYQRPVGQVVKTGASHAPNGSSTLPRVTILPLLLRGQDINLIVGAFNGEGPPVPIPNTEVKLTCADNTCLETDWEDRSVPTRKDTALWLCLFSYFEIFGRALDEILCDVHSFSAYFRL